MNLQFIKYFLTLAETNNFGQAANKMNVVQSTFSAGIKKLEEQLDCKLFYRDKRNVRLTPEGVKLMDMARELMQCWNNIEYAFNDHESRELTVGLLKNVLMDAVLPRLNRFRKSFPQYTIKVEEGTIGQLKKKLKSEELDCVIAKENDLLNEAFSTSFLYEERLMLTVSDDHELAGKSSVLLQYLQDLPMIKRSSCSLFDEVYARLEAEDIRFNAVFSSENDDVVRGLVASGVGCALMSKPEHADKGLVYLPIQDAEFTSNIMISWNKSTNKNSLRSFLKV